MIRTRFATVEFNDVGCVTRFSDGTQYGALPHSTSEYLHVTHLCGYGDDTLSYCQHHDLAHSVLAEHFGQASRVLWALAHGEAPGAQEAASEEALTLALQKFVMTDELTFVDRVPWEALRARFLELLP